MAASWMVLIAAMEALGVSAGAAGEHARERLIVLDARGQVIRVVEGLEGRVEFPSDMAGMLASPEARLTLVHNHPASNGLSPYDLVQLEKPGVHAVVAVGHDGSVYVAGRGASYDAAIHTEAASAAQRLQRRQRDPNERAAFDQHFYHVMGLALHDARVIEYRAVLSAGRRAAFESGAGFLARVQRAAAEAATK